MTRRDQTIEYLREYKTATSADLVGVAGKSKPDCCKMLSRMLRAGEVRIAGLQRVCKTYARVYELTNG